MFEPISDMPMEYYDEVCWRCNTESACIDVNDDGVYECPSCIIKQRMIVANFNKALHFDEDVMF